MELLKNVQLVHFCKYPWNFDLENMVMYSQKYDQIEIYHVKDNRNSDLSYFLFQIHNKSLIYNRIYTE